MTKHEFNLAFAPMAKALRVQVNVEQANTFFDEFQRHDKRDFAHACRELSMGNPGYLPKLVFFRDNVLAAKEIREDKAKAAGLKSFAHHLTAGGVGTKEDQLFGKLCLLNILHIVTGQDPAKAQHTKDVIETVLADPGFQAYTFDWISKSGLRPQDWLQAEIDKPFKPSLQVGA